MRFYLLVLFTSFILNSYIGCSQNNLKEISEKIIECQLSNEIKKKTPTNTYHEIRMDLINNEKLGFIKSIDTIYILETYSYEIEIFYGNIWNGTSKLEYSYNKNKFDFNIGKIFSNYTIELIENWDIETIRYEERNNSTMTNPNLIYGTRVIRNESEIDVDCICFDEFFLLERDR